MSKLNEEKLNRKRSVDLTFDYFEEKNSRSNSLPNIHDFDSLISKTKRKISKNEELLMCSNNNNNSL